VDLLARRPLRELGPLELHVGDFLGYQRQGFGLVIGNPPFKVAEEHVLHSLELLKPGGYLAFLLRLGFLGSFRRAVGLWSRPGLLHVAPIAPRPSFYSKARLRKTERRSGSNDKSEYALFLWRAGYAGFVELGEPIVWRLPPRLQAKRAAS
jgi:hypothetical protein